MVIDIKMCRFDNVPWGFRLVGGADYEYPLTVVKVRHDHNNIIYKCVYYTPAAPARCVANVTTTKAAAAFIV